MLPGKAWCAASDGVGLFQSEACCKQVGTTCAMQLFQGAAKLPVDPGGIQIIPLTERKKVLFSKAFMWQPPCDMSQRTIHNTNVMYVKFQCSFCVVSASVKTSTICVTDIINAPQVRLLFKGCPDLWAAFDTVAQRKQNPPCRRFDISLPDLNEYSRSPSPSTQPVALESMQTSGLFFCHVPAAAFRQQNHRCMPSTTVSTLQLSAARKRRLQTASCAAFAGVC